MKLSDEHIRSHTEAKEAMQSRINNLLMQLE